MDAPIVEELDDGDLPLRVPLDGRALIREEALPVIVDGLLRLRRGRRRLPLLQAPEGLREHLGLPQEIVADDLLDLLLGELRLIRADREAGDEHRHDETDETGDSEASDAMHGSF